MPRPDSNLSKNISFHELTNTMYDDLLDENRLVTDHEYNKLTLLARTILQPIRNQFRLPIIIHSGFRGAELNVKVGGVPSSQHAKAEAADFHIKGFDDFEGTWAVFEWIHKESGIPFGQLIHEWQELEGREDSLWIHISLGQPYRPPNECGEILTYRNGVYRMLGKAY